MGLRQIDLDKQKSVRFCAHSRRSAVASATNFLKRGVRIHSGAFCGLQENCSPPGSFMEESNELELIQFQGTGVQLIVGAF